MEACDIDAAKGRDPNCAPQQDGAVAADLGFVFWIAEGILEVLCFVLRFSGKSTSFCAGVETLERDIGLEKQAADDHVESSHGCEPNADSIVVHLIRSHVVLRRAGICTSYKMPRFALGVVSGCVVACVRSAPCGSGLPRPNNRIWESRFRF